ncbi:MAG: hypothetical protein J6V22_02560, partial [Clostridia bacterium]|nr:hypothetical protein [Clostridia bacterium]
MKFIKLLQKIKPMLSKYIPMIGLLVGLVIVPILWSKVLEVGHFYYTIYSLICLVFLALYYNSFIRLKATYNDELYAAFREELNEESTIKDYLAFLFQKKNFWIQYAVIALMFILVPIRTVVPAVAWLFGAYGNLGKELLALVFFLPFLFIIYTAGHISAIDYWQQQVGMKRDVSKKTKRKTYFSILVAYAIVPFALLMVWNFVTLYVPLIFELFQITSSVLLVVVIVFSIAFAILFSFFRVIRARKKCIKEILRICKEKNYDITAIKRPYLSAFHVCRGESFQVTTEKKTYSCKLVGAPQRGIPLIVHPMGGLHFMYSFNLFKAQIFSHTTVRHFGYDSEYSKILMIKPVPTKLFCHFGNKIDE